MTAALSNLAFALALLGYGAASVLFFLEVARRPAPPKASSSLGDVSQPARPPGGPAPPLLAIGAIGHAGYVTFASFIAHVCPIHSIHFFLSVAALLAITLYLVVRVRLGMHALGMLVSPFGLALLLGTFFLGQPAPAARLSPLFIGLHVLSNLLGVALFLLAGAAASLYLVQEKRLKLKRAAPRTSGLPPLETLDRAVHRFLLAGFPLLTLGIVTGTFWSQKLETGTADEVMRIVFGYATWLLVALVLLLRAAAGWRGRRAAYGTIAGFLCAVAVVVVYLVRPGGGAGG